MVVWVPLFALGGWCVLAGSPAHGERWLRGRLLERLPALGMWAASGSCMAAGLVFFSADEDVALRRLARVGARSGKPPVGSP